MALCGTVEVAVHLGSFRSIDLWAPGFSQLRCALYEGHPQVEPSAVDGADQGNAVVSGGLSSLGESSVTTGLRRVPPSFVCKDRDLTADEPPEASAALCRDGSSFRTRAVQASRSKSELQFNDIALFHIEQAVDDNVYLTLEMRLMWAECPNERDALMRSLFKDRRFREVARQNVLIHCHPNGSDHSLHPVYFEDINFSEVKLMVHTAVVGMRMRMPLQLSRDGLRNEMAELSSRLGAAPDQQVDKASLADSVESVGAVIKQRLQGACEGLQVFVDKIIEKQEWKELQWHDRGSVNKLEDEEGLDQDELLLKLEGPDNNNEREKKGVDEHKAERENSQGCQAEKVRQRAVCNSQDTSALRRLVEDICAESKPVLKLWQKLIRLLPHALHGVSQLLEEAKQQQEVQHWENHVFVEVCPSGNIKAPSDREQQSTHIRRSTSFWQKSSPPQQAVAAIDNANDTKLKAQQAQCLRSFDAQACPIIFEQRYAPQREQQQQSDDRPRSSLTSDQQVECDTDDSESMGLHCVVLVHGFMGHSWDMRLFKNHLSARFPRLYCLCSRANEGDTSGDIGCMGAMLAEEIKAHLEAVASRQPVDRISFVCHSMGGLLVRSCLPHLSDFADKMFSFVSLSSPHLGFMHAASSLIKTGLWFASKVKKSICLDQLRMSDATDPRKSYLFSLSSSSGLEHFKHVVLVSSCQDQYAPFESARMEVAGCAAEDSSLGPCCVEMVDNLFKSLAPENVVRLDVSFMFTETSFDTLIGRAAHIQFIENPEFMRMFAHRYAYLFE